MKERGQVLPDEPTVVILDPSAWTYGAEYEWSDWDSWVDLGAEGTRDRRDVTMVNSNGIAVDPKATFYRYGGEINTRVCSSPEDLAKNCTRLKALVDHQATINYRSNLHIHVGVPGLVGDLPQLQQLQKHICTVMPEVLRWLEPIPIARRKDYESEDAFRGAMARAARRRRSHQTITPSRRVTQQLDARTLSEFYEREVPWDSKRRRPLWHLQPRAAVNLRQLLQTDTIEFRHFPGALSSEQVKEAAEWCRAYLLGAFSNWPGLQIREEWGRRGGNYLNFPIFLPYQHELELHYRRTCHDGTVPREEIRRNIADILAGEEVRCES